MYRIIDSRGTGKTSRLFLLAKEQNATIACRNPYGMREKAASYGISGLHFITYKEALDGLYDEKNILIDDLEIFAQYALSKYKCLGYTLSID